MPTLYVENVPEKFYDALRKQARGHGNSIAAEVMEILQRNVVTPEVLKARQEVYRAAMKMRALKPRVSADGADAVTLLRDGRESRYR